MAFEHRLEEFGRSGQPRQELVDVVEVCTHLGYGPCGVVAVLDLVAGDDPAWVERGDDVDGSAPGIAAAVGGFDEN